MRSSALLSSSLAATALCSLALAQSKPDSGGDLREQIRQIVREEVRAALREAHGTSTDGSGTVIARRPAIGRLLGSLDEAKSSDQVKEMDVEMKKLGDVVKQLEVIVDGEKLGDAGKLFGKLQIQDPDSGEVVVEDAPKGKAKAKAVAIKPDGLKFLVEGGEGKGKAIEWKPEGMQFLVEGGEGKGFAFTPASPKAKTTTKSKTGEAKTMAFRVTCENGKCKVEQVGGDCCAEGNGDCTFVIKTDCGDGKCNVQVVGGGECCDTDSAAKSGSKTKAKAKKAKTKAVVADDDEEDEENEKSEKSERKVELKPIQLKLPALRLEAPKDPRGI